MRKINYFRFLFFLLFLRIVISLSVSDGKLRSDSLNYFGLSLNLIGNFTFTAITPVNEEALRGGVTPAEFFDHFSQHPSPYRRLMNYQWLHSLLYIPVILLFTSLYAIIIVNNLLFLGAGYYLFDLIKDKVSETDLRIGWMMFLFFPPFFYLTNQFYSEPLFLFFLAVIINGIVKKRKAGVLFVVSLILLPVTRGFGLIFLAGCIALLLWERDFRSAALVSVCGGMAFALNMLAGANIRDPQTITVDSPPPVAHSVYFTNTVYGNGDNDYFLEYPEKQREDRFFSDFLDGKQSTAALLAEIAAQNFRDPAAFAVTMTNRLGAYFLNVIPDSWNYNGITNQSMLKKILWSLQNVGFILLVWMGIQRSGVRYRRIFSMLFWVSCAAHLIALSRYRYFQPVLIAGIPAAVAGAARLRAVALRLAKKNAPSP